MMVLLSPDFIGSSKWVIQLSTTSLTGIETSLPFNCGSIQVALIGPDGFGVGTGVGFGVGVGVGLAHPTMIDTSENNTAPATIFLSIYCTLLYIVSAAHNCP
jgi:hypothetical protein